MNLYETEKTEKREPSNISDLHSGKKICVVGLGYIGLPTSAVLASAGHRVHGVDVNPQVVKTLQQGKIHLHEPGLASLVQDVVQKD